MERSTKVLAGVVIVSILFCNCSSSGGGNNINSEPQEICQAFVKAICTKDTVAFFKLVDKAYLTNSMNEWANNGKRITQDDLFFPFFFVYGPLKIRYEDLIRERNRKKFFAYFKIEHEEAADEFNISVSITWIQNFPAAEPRNIELRLKKNNEWKIVGAKWKVL